MNSLISNIYLKDANSQVLKLKGALHVRGMIEDLEKRLSNNKARDPNISRKKLWTKYLNNDKDLLKVLTECVKDGSKENLTAVVNLICSLFGKANDLHQHHVGQEDITVDSTFYHADEVCIINALAVKYAYKTNVV